jgi:FkbM family methyltransferase
VVYSFGVGGDISFDLQLMNRFNLHVHAFDPSPNSIEWVRVQKLPKEFHFYPIGLSARDGSISFSEPSDPGISSLRMTDLVLGQEAGLKTHSLPVNRLTTIMEKLGHHRLDILKMDIEGAEYEVVEDLLESDIQVSQLLIEFHHRFSYIGTKKTRRAIQRLNEAGFKIFDVSPSGEEMSFINGRG